jgi:hypothetical protein
MVSLEFFVDIILPTLPGLTQSLTEMSIRNISCGDRRPVRRADKLTTFMCLLSWNLGTPVSWNPQGLSRPVTGLLYLYFTFYLTLNPLTWKIWWAPNNASRWKMGFNSAFKGLIAYCAISCYSNMNTLLLFVWIHFCTEAFFQRDFTQWLLQNIQGVQGGMCQTSGECSLG